MIGDIKVFLFLMVMFMVAHGVCLNSFINPNQTYLGVGDTLFKVLYMPYFQIYGELFLENYENQEIEVNNYKEYLQFKNTTEGRV